MPETVAVIGGGDVAMDACRAALRLPGCTTVKVVYRRGPEEIPARMQTRAADDLKRLVCDGLQGAGLAFTGASGYATPRRLAISSTQDIPRRGAEITGRRIKTA